MSLDTSPVDMMWYCHKTHIKYKSPVSPWHYHFLEALWIDILYWFMLRFVCNSIFVVTDFKRTCTLLSGSIKWVWLWVALPITSLGKLCIRRVLEPLHLIAISRLLATYDTTCGNRKKNSTLWCISPSDDQIEVVQKSRGNMLRSATKYNSG